MESHLNNPEKIHGSWEHSFSSPMLIRHNGTAIMDGATYFQRNYAWFKSGEDIIIQKPDSLRMTGIYETLLKKWFPMHQKAITNAIDNTIDNLEK